MSAPTKTRIIGELTEISFTVPNAIADSLRKVVDGLLELVPAMPKRAVNEDGDELYSADEVFPDASPAMALRGLRVREDLTQKAFAERLGIRQHHVSEMEKGKRAISVEMAKRIGEVFDISYKVFL
ncbi:MAG: helix-turn-helix domain-containing protein [Desulfobulbaceae bacterium]|jgi:DNA-binding XRE family transcriptional regulator|nr:helix-turn-helix domain-containing protein [Desulfobulbaceae bacterium]